MSVDFEALCRASRDDAFAYVATLLRDRAAAEDVTELGFERHSGAGAGSSPVTVRSRRWRLSWP